MMTNDKREDIEETVKMIATMVVLGILIIDLFSIMLNSLFHPSYMEGKRAMEAVYVGDDTFVDSDGEAWEYNGTGYKLNEDVVLVFDTLDTDTIYDDEIVDIQY